MASIEPMSSSAERILEALEIDRRKLCDDCIADIADVAPRQQVNSICNRLKASGSIVRDKAKCGACGASKFVNALVSPSAALTPNIHQPTDLRPGPLRTAQAIGGLADLLDARRREMVRMLDHLEGARAKGRGVSQRVSLLRDAGVLPGNIACMMQTVNSLRNLCVYERHVLGEHEIHVFQSAWAAVDGWWKTRS